MLKEWDTIWQTVRLALEKQNAEAPDFFAPYWIQAQRLAMPVLLMFTAAVSILFAWALLEFAVRRKKQWVLFQRAVVLVVCAVLCVWVFSLCRLLRRIPTRWRCARACREKRKR